MNGLRSCKSPHLIIRKLTWHHWMTTMWLAITLWFMEGMTLNKKWRAPSLVHIQWQICINTLTGCFSSSAKTIALFSISLLTFMEIKSGLSESTSSKSMLWFKSLKRSQKQIITSHAIWLLVWFALSYLRTLQTHSPPPKKRPQERVKTIKVKIKQTVVLVSQRKKS